MTRLPNSREREVLYSVHYTARAPCWMRGFRIRICQSCAKLAGAERTGHDHDEVWKIGGSVWLGGSKDEY